MRFDRGSGILLHPTSLPGPFGVGDLGGEAFVFIDQLENAGQRYWQVLPLGPPGSGNSPYSAFSAFAGNTLLVSPERLVADGLLDGASLDTAPQFGSRADYPAAAEWKNRLLRTAFERFRSDPTPTISDEYTHFVRSNAWWLDDWALFWALKISHGGAAWLDWAGPLRLREAGAIAVVRAQLAREIDAEKFFQYLFFRQWLELRRYANEKGIRIIGDIPIFVALDSADVWCNQAGFKLDEDGSPRVVAGVPPDYFSETGQLWGNPIFDWDAMLRDDLGWWTARIAFARELADTVRLDHFIGFSRNWEVPGGDETAENGEWVVVPGDAIFETLKRRLGPLPLIAEDLGSLTPDVEQLRDRFGFPGMRILQYAFGGDARNRDLPHNYVNNCVAYTGTHDNDTIVGWYANADRRTKQHLRRYARNARREINWEMIRLAMASVADVVIFPAQDLIGLGSEARMNTPATPSGNWEWRLEDGQISPQCVDRLLEMTLLYGR